MYVRKHNLDRVYVEPLFTYSQKTMSQTCNPLNALYGEACVYRIDVSLITKSVSL